MVIILVSAILGLYIICVVLAYRWDSQDRRKLASIPLCGRDGLYKYEITVVTGRRLGAGMISALEILFLANGF